MLHVLGFFVSGKKQGGKKISIIRITVKLKTVSASMATVCLSPEMVGGNLGLLKKKKKFLSSFYYNSTSKDCVGGRRSEINV
jgi:hypothetical protein